MKSPGVVHMAEAMPTVAELTRLLERLSGPEPDCTGDAERVDLISTLEAVKSACSASQARLAVTFEASQRAEQAAEGVPAARRGKGVASQVALARRESPVKGGRLLGLAKALVHEMPHTLAALARGEISEWRATIMVRETATLSVEHRLRVDAAMAATVGKLGDQGVAREARKLAYELDPRSPLKRMRGARSDRRVTVRPAPDTMSYLTGFLPAEQGIAVHTALSRHADTLRSSGDQRTRGQIMADTLVERVTGQSEAPATPTEISLVMTDRSLLGTDTTPARLTGYGPIPSAIAKDILRASHAAKTWVRRLYTSPTTGELVGMDSTRRLFPAGLRRLLVIRDEVCRTSWCDAPIRHADHVVRSSDGGETSADNGQGLCEACNQAKEAPGWSSSAGRAWPAGRHTVTVTTPTGHQYSSRAPDLPDRRGRASIADLRLATAQVDGSAGERRLKAVVGKHREELARAG